MAPDCFTRQDWIRCSDLSMSQRWVMVCIAHRAGDGNDCWASAARLAKEAGCTDRGFRKILRELVESGVVSLTPRAGKTNSVAINWAHLKPPEDAPGAEPHSGVNGSEPGTTFRGGLNHAPGPPEPRSAKRASNTPRTNKSAQRSASAPYLKCAPFEKSIRDWCARFAKEDFKDLDSAAQRFAEFDNEWLDPYAAERGWLSTWLRVGRTARTNPQQMSMSAYKL